MKLVFHSIILCAFMMLVAFTSHAQTVGHSPPLTITTAIERAQSQSFELHRQNALLEIKRAEQRQLSLLANPSTAFSREELRNQDKRMFEWTISVDYPLLSLLTRGNRTSAADLTVEAATFSRSHAMNALRFDIQNSFLDVWRLREILQAIQDMEPSVLALEKAATQRTEQGEISSYDQLRLRSELSRIRWRITESTEALRASEATLARHLAMPSDSLAALPVVLPTIPVHAIDMPRLVQTGLNGRNDLHALRSERSALARQRSWLRSMWMDDVRIGGGYKQQSDAFRGPMLSISLPLPLFDRNQGRVDESGAQHARLTTDIVAREYEIQLDIRNAAAAYLHLHTQAASLPAPDANTLTQLVTTATTAYQEGEFSLVEYLDAVAMYMDGTELRATVTTSLLRAAFRLEYAVGASVFSIQETNR